MTVELRIALRYLFARKRQNAINIVSAVSAAGVCVVTAALIIVLSVMNGFSSLVEGMFSQFDPELKITAAHGKTFLLSEPFIQEVRAMPSVEVFCPCVQENALVQFADKQMAATLKGVTDDFRQLSRIDSIIIGGSFSVQEQLINPDGTVGRRFERCVVGSGLAEKLGVSAWNMSGLRFYAPKKGERINMVNPERSLNEEGAFMSGVFSVQQDKYDASFIVVSLDLARSLFDLKSDEVTAVELKLTEGDKTNLKTVSFSLMFSLK